MILDFLNEYQNNSIINKTKKRFYLFSNIVLIVGIIFFLFTISLLIEFISFLIPVVVYNTLGPASLV